MLPEALSPTAWKLPDSEANQTKTRNWH